MKSSPKRAGPDRSLQEGVFGYVIATTMLADIGIGLALGYQADTAQGTMPLWTLTGFFVGALAAGLSAWLILRVLRQRRESSKP